MSLRPSVALLVLTLLVPITLPAQRVTADIAIGGGPVAGRIIIGDPAYHHGGGEYRGAPRYRPVTREVIEVRGHRGHGWYHRHGWRPVRVWYDAPRRIYYHDRPLHAARGLRLVVVYERDGRYVWDDMDRGWRDDDRRGWSGDEWSRDDRDGREGYQDRRGRDSREDDRRDDRRH